MTIPPDVAPDGSPVEVYGRLPPMGEAELIHRAVPDGASILELGAGAGRVTRRLLALGHPVTAVDESPAMLAEIPPEAEAVLGDARGLALGRRFGAVLLGSHLVNGVDGAGPACLRVARSLLASDGVVVAEVYPPGFDWGAAIGRSSRMGEVSVTLTRAALVAGRLDAEVRYEVGGRVWRQPFTADRLTETELVAVLQAAGFELDRWLDRERGWLLARPR